MNAQFHVEHSVNVHVLIAGAVLWSVDAQHMNVDWNVYQALPLPDWDADGVPELLVAHGGDFKYGPEVRGARGGEGRGGEQTGWI